MPPSNGRLVYPARYRALDVQLSDTKMSVSRTRRLLPYDKHC